MALRKIKLGELITRHDIRNKDNLVKNVMGISVKKCFREPTSKVNRDELKSYKLVKPGWFSSVQTTHNEKCFAFAYNDTDKEIVVSSVNVVFSVNKKVINPRWLQMYFNRVEFDRYARNNSWGSAREIFSWDDLCNVCLDLPDLQTQQKYVDIYLSMLENQKTYERGLEDLKLVCDAYIEDLRRKMPCEKIGSYINRAEKNTNNKISKVLGIGQSGFIKPQKNPNESLKNYKILQKGDICYAPPLYNILTGAMHCFMQEESAVCSPIYEVFRCNQEKLLPEYLILWLRRNEFIRYATFYALGVRQTFDYNLMEDVKVPIPNIKKQLAIANIYKCYIERKEINEKLKQQIKDICPILIKGSIEESK